jgi:hypothetical protein
VPSGTHLLCCEFCNDVTPWPREPFYVSIWFGQGVIWVGILGSIFLCFWLSVVPNQRQLSIVVSDWGSYLGSPFPSFCVGSCLCLCAGSLHNEAIRVVVFFIVLSFPKFHFVNKLCGTQSTLRLGLILHPTTPVT